MHRQVVPAVAQDFNLNPKEIGLEGDDPAQPPQQRRETLSPTRTSPSSPDRGRHERQA
jgi:hypothetical protein